MTLEVQALQDAVKTAATVQPTGAGTKNALRSNSAVHRLDLTKLSGIIEHQPSEFIITTWAGTPIAQVQTVLGEKGQYLPFDPLLAEAGATVGGTVAANASGPERYRYGGVRDFIIGCHFIDGNGELLHGGGKVVKNAAGFDYPKLFVGSMGTLGALVDVTFKVFPAPEAYATLVVPCDSLEHALTLLPKLTNSPYDINAIDLHPASPHSQPPPLQGRGDRILIRVGGLAAGLPQRMDRVRALCNGGDVIDGTHESAMWREAREFLWAEPNAQVLKVPITPSRIPALDGALGDLQRHYSVGGNVAWIAAPPDHALDALLSSLKLSGVVLRNGTGALHIGTRARNAFADRVKRALDPLNKFS